MNNDFFKQYNSEIIGSIICLFAGMLSGYLAHAGDTTWYQSLHKPEFNPPVWAFTPVWIVLYTMMGVALGKIWNYRNQNNNFLLLFMIQFVFNIAWTPLFFGMHRIDLALYDVILLWISLAILLIATRNINSIFMMLLPYFLWVTFVAALNFNIYQLNPESSKPSYLKLYEKL